MFNRFSSENGSFGISLLAFAMSLCDVVYKPFVYHAQPHALQTVHLDSYSILFNMCDVFVQYVLS